MNSMVRIGAGALALLVLGGGAYALLGGESGGGFRAAVPVGEVVDLDWDMLVPEGREGVETAGVAQPAGVVQHETLGDDTAPWQADTDTGAVRHELDGARVRIPGYMTPLSWDDAEVGEFLLVPYVGACVHVPPPPANQIVYVEVEGTVPVLEMWEPFLAVGTLQTSAKSTELAEVGYTMRLEHLEIYEEPEPDVFDDTGGDEPPALTADDAGAGGTALGQVFEDAFGPPGDALGEPAATTGAAPTQ